MTCLLAIDTATECCSAALWFDGKLYSKSTVQAQKHAELILSFIDDLFAQSGACIEDVQGLVLGQGPGAFTGVRIATGVAQGIALAHELPVVAVSNLQTLAHRALSDHSTGKESLNILVATDARMKEVYSAQYQWQSGELIAISNETVGPAGNVNTTECDIYIGSGFHVYEELKAFMESKPMVYETLVYSEAKDMLMMVKDDFDKLAVSIETVEPVYLREP